MTMPDSVLNRAIGPVCAAADLKRFQQGTTLFEVLVALLVLMIGFVAIAGLQGFSFTSNHNAFLRTQATIQAHDMVDRMYANAAGVAAGSYNSISGISSNPPTCLTSAAYGTDALASVDCTSAQIAAFDAWEWNSANAALLPSGTGTVAGPDGSGVYTITVTWVEQGSDGTENQSFAFQVKPLP
jgi:type IV pilus assembly protein PilV